MTEKAYSPLTPPDAAAAAGPPASVTQVQNAPGQDSRFSHLEEALRNGDKLTHVDPRFAGKLGFAKPGEVQITMGVDAQNKGQITIRTPERPDGTARKETVVGGLNEKEDMETLARIMSRAQRSDLPTKESEKLQKRPIVPAENIISQLLKEDIDQARFGKTRCKVNKPGEHCI